jgi:hypothetical protein
MRGYGGIRSWPLAVLLVLSLSVSNASAVSISLVPDGSTTIGIGETVNVDAFLALDPSDRAVGISAATLHLELGSPFVDVVASSGGSVFPNAIANVVPGENFIAFSQFGATVTSPMALLGSLSITGKAPGSYDLVARRFGPFPLFTAPGTALPNRYDFASDETLAITVICGSDVCVAPSPGPVDPLPPEPPPVPPISPTDEPPPATTVPEVDVGKPESTHPDQTEPPLYKKPGGVNHTTTISTVLCTDSGGINYNLGGGGQIKLTAFAPAGSHSAAIPEPCALFLIGLSIAGLAILRPWRANA